MSEQNNYLSADDFLAGVLNEPVDYELAGLGWVQVRGLTYAEVIATQKRLAGDNFGLTLETVRLGLVQPVLTQEQMKLLEEARPGVIIELSKRIMALSGMGDEETAKN